MNHRYFILILAALSASLTPAKAELAWSIDDIVKPSDLHCYKTSAPSNDELLTEILKTEETRLGEILETLLKDPSGRISQSTQGENAIDAAQRIFGKRVGLQILYIFSKYRVNASHFQKENTSPWKAAELDDVLLALSDIPSHLVPLPMNRYMKAKGYITLVRHKRGDPKFDGDAPTYADAGINLYDAWSELPTQFPRRNRVLHEVAHNFKNMIRNVNGKNWENLSYSKKNDSAFATRYAKTNSYEDLAESIIAYRYVPLWLKKRNPEKYEYIREVYFDGIEYTSEEACKNENRTVLKAYDAELNKAFSERQWNLIDPTLRKGKVACDTKFLVNLSKPEHDQCLASTYGTWFAGQYRSESIKYLEDMRDVRSVDGTGGIRDPKMNTSLMVKTGNAARAVIRQAFTTDFNTFQNQAGTDAKSCDQFATDFNDWMKGIRGKNSAMRKSGVYDSPYASYVTTLRLICEKGIATRPSYVKLLEKIKGQGPLTATEFRHGIQETIP